MFTGLLEDCEVEEIDNEGCSECKEGTYEFLIESLCIGNLIKNCDEVDSDDPL